MITKFDAIKSLVPNAELLVDAKGNVRWIKGDNIPTEDEIRDEMVRLEYVDEIQEYQRQRASTYPDWASQLDYIYHNGVDAWKTDIVDPVKIAYPKVEVDETELASRQAQALHDYQLEEYTKALTRLAQYQVALGREEQTEEFVIGQEWNEETEEMVDVTETRVTAYALEPVEATVEHTTYDEEGNAVTVTVDNPLITADNEERAEAQAIVDATPQEVIDAYNAL